MWLCGYMAMWLCGKKRSTVSLLTGLSTETKWEQPDASSASVSKPSMKKHDWETLVFPRAKECYCTVHVYLSPAVPLCGNLCGWPLGYLAIVAHGPWRVNLVDFQQDLLFSHGPHIIVPILAFQTTTRINIVRM